MPPAASRKKPGRVFRKALRILGLKKPKNVNSTAPSAAASTGIRSPSTVSVQIGDFSDDDNFGPVLRIPDDSVVDLALDVASKSLAVPNDALTDGPETVVIDKLKGHNNRVFIVRYQNGLEICVRVPACGWEGAWTEKDAEALRTQVLTMQYIKRNTNCPIPEILTYDTTLNNAIHAPYVAMTYAEGRPIEDVWFDEDEELEYEELEEKRQRILRSLAFGVAELRSLTFDKMGALRFTSDDDNNPVPGPAHILNFGISRTPSFLAYIEELEKENEPQPNSEVYFRKVLEKWNNKVPESAEGEAGERDTWEHLSAYHLFSMLLDELPFTKTGQTETFVLSPPDFDGQNILVDDHGNVTAILDWDRIETCPRFVGWCRFPEFLHVDWYLGGDYLWPHDGETTMSPMQHDKYRADYCRYMAEACDGAGDCKYTAKSHLYGRILDAVGEIVAQERVLEALTAMVVPRVDVTLLRQYIGGEGLKPEEEEVIRQGFRKLLES